MNEGEGYVWFNGIPIPVKTATFVQTTTAPDCDITISGASSAEPSSERPPNPLRFYRPLWKRRLGIAR